MPDVLSCLAKSLKRRDLLPAGGREPDARYAATGVAFRPEYHIFRYKSTEIDTILIIPPPILPLEGYADI